MISAKTQNTCKKNQQESPFRGGMKFWKTQTYDSFALNISN